LLGACLLPLFVRNFAFKLFVLAPLLSASGAFLFALGDFFAET
jgi:hypothetical protein